MCKCVTKAAKIGSKKVAENNLISFINIKYILYFDRKWDRF